MSQDDVPKVDSINWQPEKCPSWLQCIQHIVAKSEVNEEGGVTLPLVVYPQLLLIMTYTVGQFIHIN